MPPEIKARAFEPFFTTKGSVGTGLGMSMVYGIVQRHRGEIDVSSEVGQGTTVRLSFPAVPKTTAGRSGRVRRRRRERSPRPGGGR